MQNLAIRSFSACEKEQSALHENVITHQTPTTDFHSPFIERLTLRQSL
jgi:hypothetical protein